MFPSIQYRNGWLAASNLFDMFTQSIMFYTFHYQHRCLKNVIHQIDSKNAWLLLSASFTTRFGLVLVLTNRMVTTKWVYHREQSFTSNYFIFLKVLFYFKNLMNNWFNVPSAQTPILLLFLSAGVLFDGAFSLWVSLRCLYMVL